MLSFSKRPFTLLCLCAVAAVWGYSSAAKRKIVTLVPFSSVEQDCANRDSSSVCPSTTELSSARASSAARDKNLPQHSRTQQRATESASQLVNAQATAANVRASTSEDSFIANSFPPQIPAKNIGVYKKNSKNHETDRLANRSTFSEFSSGNGSVPVSENVEAPSSSQAVAEGQSPAGNPYEQLYAGSFDESYFYAREERMLQYLASTIVGEVTAASDSSAEKNAEQNANPYIQLLNQEVDPEVVAAETERRSLEYLSHTTQLQQ